MGKSTLFNALTRKQLAEASNFPFCTIEVRRATRRPHDCPPVPPRTLPVDRNASAYSCPSAQPNVAKVEVPDARLDQLMKLAGSARRTPCQMEFVDIAGLIKGASEGQGLGNKFLGNIRTVSVVLHVVRCFEDPDIIHVEADGVNPTRDISTINTELILADLQSVEKRLEQGKRAKKKDEADSATIVKLLEQAQGVLEDGKPVRTLWEAGAIEPAHVSAWQQLQLITQKPMLYVCNVDEATAVKHKGDNDMTRAVREFVAARDPNAGVLSVAAGLENELAALETEAARQEYLAEMGVAESGLGGIIRESRRLLGDITFYTVGPTESRAWSLRSGSTARDAAGEIHTDMAKGFIRAETMAMADFVAYGGEAGTKEAGRLRLEGADYVVHDGDIMLFRFRNTS